MLDLTESIAPRSDQLNADDLISGPQTFTITEVRKGSAEQPFDFHLAEIPGRPYKPSKSMRRILVLGWGPDASQYAGRRLTLYREPKVKWAGQEIGGIRISAMSHLDKPLRTALTESKSKREPFTVQPLADAPPTRTNGITRDQLKQLADAFRDHDIENAADGLAYIARVIGRDVASSRELTTDEAAKVIGSLGDPPAPEGGAA